MEEVGKHFLKKMSKTYHLPLTLELDDVGHLWNIPRTRAFVFLNPMLGRFSFFRIFSE
jgi:hypothetical protein